MYSYANMERNKVKDMHNAYSCMYVESSKNFVLMIICCINVNMIMMQVVYKVSVHVHYYFAQFRYKYIRTYFMFLNDIMCVVNHSYVWSDMYSTNRYLGTPVNMYSYVHMT